jgi:hypothetical protein
MAEGWPLIIVGLLIGGPFVLVGIAIMCGWVSRCWPMTTQTKKPDPISEAGQV